MLSVIRRACYSTLDTGSGFTRKIYLLNNNQQKISFWNDVPLKDPKETEESIFNAIIEIPRFTLGKFELSKTEEFHPIVQDTKKCKKDKSKRILRFYAQHGYFNYGLFPQTWENCLIKNQEVDNLSVSNQPILSCINFLGR